MWAWMRVIRVVGIAEKGRFGGIWAGFAGPRAWSSRVTMGLVIGLGIL